MQQARVESRQLSEKLPQLQNDVYQSIQPELAAKSRHLGKNCPAVPCDVIELKNVHAMSTKALGRTLWIVQQIHFDHTSQNCKQKDKFPLSNSSTVRSSDLPARTFCQKCCPAAPQFYLLNGAYLSVLKAEVLQYRTVQQLHGDIKCRYSQLREHTPVRNCPAAPTCDLK
jgi:hypothetical protein